MPSILIKSLTLKAWRVLHDVLGLGFVRPTSSQAWGSHWKGSFIPTCKARVYLKERHWMALTWISSNIFRLLKLFLRHLPPATVLPGASAATHSCYGQAHRSQIGRWHWHRSSFTCKCLRKKRWMDWWTMGCSYKHSRFTYPQIEWILWDFNIDFIDSLWAPWFLLFSFLHIKFLLESLASTCQLCPGVWPVCGCAAQAWLRLATCNSADFHMILTDTQYVGIQNILRHSVRCPQQNSPRKICLENETRYDIHNFLSFTTGITNTKNQIPINCNRITFQFELIAI